MSKHRLCTLMNDRHKQTESQQILVGCLAPTLPAGINGSMSYEDMFRWASLCRYIKSLCRYIKEFRGQQGKRDLYHHLASGGHTKSNELTKQLHWCKMEAWCITHAQECVDTCVVLNPKLA